MRRKIIGIFVIILMSSCSTMTFALTPFNGAEQQTNDQFLNSTSVPLPLPKRWMKTFGGTNDDWGSSVQQTKDGGYIILGHTSSFGYGAWLIKTDDNGNEEWNRTFGMGEVGYSVQQTTDDGYIIVGSNFNYDVLLIKTNDNGNEEWNRTFGRSGADGGSAVQQTSDGGYIILGRTQVPGTFEIDVWLIKTDDNGNEKWNKTFGAGGERNFIVGSFIQQTTDDGYIITGSKQNSFIQGRDVLLIKADSNGEKEWERVFGKIIGDDWGSFVQQTTDGGYIIVGSRSLMGIFKWLYNHDVWLIKTNKRGIKLWDKTFGQIGDDDNGYSVQQTTDGGYIIAGSKGNSFRDLGVPSYVWLIKTNGRGKHSWDRIFKLWDKNFKGLIYYYEEGYSVQQTTDGGYIITGSKGTPDANAFGGFFHDVWLIKTNRLGMSKTTSVDKLWFEQLFQRFPNAFPLRQLMGY